MDAGQIVLLILGVIVVVMQVLILNKKNDYSNLNNGISKNLNENKFEIEKVMLSFKDQLTTQLNREYGELKLSINKNISENNEKINREIVNFKDNFSKNLTADFKSLNDELEKRLTKINDKVEERLNEGFKKTTETFNNILERISKIDEAQKNIEKLSVDIVDLQSVLTDKKSRGTFGEVQLNQILQSIFGDNNKKIYELQKSFSNGTIVDAVIYAPEPLGMVSIDSKFPLENYRKMIDKTLEETLRTTYTKKFVTDVKKHIDDISTKYIISGETSEQAIMFIPAEAVFAEINAYHDGIATYAQKRKVALTSPTTLMSMLTIIQAVLKDIERGKYAREIQIELEKLGSEFNRYKERWDKLQKNINTVSESVKAIHTTTGKISNRFESISKVQIDEKEVDKINE